MGARAPTQFVLTPKGIDELSQRTYRLDARVRNILFLIQKGTPTVEGILENTIFPQDEVVKRLQNLLKDEFVALGSRESAPESAPESAQAGPPAPPLKAEPPAGPALAPAPTLAPASILALATQSVAPKSATPAAPPAPLERAASDFPQLDARISVSQARYVLSDFCLDLFGTKGKPLIEQIDAAADLDALQKVLELVTREVRKHRRPQMTDLLARVRQINQLPESTEAGLGASFGG
jgi:hypothetical protein